jgi:hypothetical protein
VGRRCHNDLIDTENAAILDVEASRVIRQADVGASRTMLARTAERFGLKPKRVIADGAYGSAHNLAGLVMQHKIEPYISVFDKSQRTTEPSHDAPASGRSLMRRRDPLMRSLLRYAVPTSPRYCGWQ